MGKLYEKNMEKKKNFLASLKSMKKGVSDPELDPEPVQDLEPDPDPLFRGTDPGIRIRTKMSWIPNTAFYIPKNINIRKMDQP